MPPVTHFHKQFLYYENKDLKLVNAPVTNKDRFLRSKWEKLRWL